MREKRKARGIVEGIFPVLSQNQRSLPTFLTLFLGTAAATHTVPAHMYVGIGAYMHTESLAEARQTIVPIIPGIYPASDFASTLNLPLHNCGLIIKPVLY